MPTTYNIYCDESCHLENDGSPIMVLGSVWCHEGSVDEISKRLREIKARHGISASWEAKWTKVSPGKLQLYLDLIDYFFDDDDLHFRGYVIEKSKLNHELWDQTHDDWYYKMCFRMLEPIISPTDCYNIYIDIKDTRSAIKCRRLKDVLRNSQRDWNSSIIKKVQQIRSHESEVLQLADLLIGAVCHINRNLNGSSAKSSIIDRIRLRSRKSLMQSTLIRESKVNLFYWQGQGPKNG